MPNATTLAMTIEEIWAELRALTQDIETRKEMFDKRIHGKEQPARYAMWLQFLADNERDLIYHAYLSRRYAGLTLNSEA